MNDELDRDQLDAWEVEPLGEGFEDRVLAAWDTAREPEATERSSSRVVLWVAGLTLAAAAALAVVLWPRLPESPADAVAIRAGSSARVEYVPGSGRAEQGAGTVTYDVPPGTPFVVHTEAADITVHGTVFTVEMLTMNDAKRRKYLGAGALVMTGAAVGVYVTAGEVEVGNGHGAVRLQPGQTAVASEHFAPRTEPAPMVATVKPAPIPTKPKTSTKRLTQAEAENVRRAIDAALGGGTEEPSDAPADEGDRSGAADDEEMFGSLEAEYIREVVNEDLVPIAQECYESALEDEPDLRGRLMLQFSIAGDESVGGIVDEVAIDEGESTLRHASLAECMTESTATLLFEPPEGGGRVNVSYAIEFEPDDAGAAD